MKRVQRKAGVAVALSLVAALLLTACGGSKPAAQPAAQPQQQAQPQPMAVGPGVTDTTITLGADTDMTGPTNYYGAGAVDGMNAYFKYINDTKGGVKGRKLVLSVEDYAYDTNKGIAAYNRLKDKVLAFGLIIYALFETIDHRVLHFSDPKKRCAFVDLCGLCIKNPAAGLSVTDCGVYRMAVLLLPLGMLLALIPLGAPLSLYAANVHVGPLVHFYIRTAIQQLFEVRYAPLAAILLFGSAWIVLLFARQSALHPLVRLLASGAAGFLGFSYFRTGLGLIYENNLALATFWEEATELVFILAALYILWVFRRGLLPGFRLPD